MDLKNIIMNLLFPQKPHCIGCNQRLATGESFLCASCERKLEAIFPPVCSKCGRPLAIKKGLSGVGSLCMDCRNIRHYFVQARAYGHYDGVLKKLIYEFKYRRRPEMAEFLGDKMHSIIKSLGWPCFDWVIPVPLHKKRLAQRGYNQSKLLAAVIARRSGIPLHDGLIRIKPTEHQTLLDKRLRWKNLQDAFKALDKTKIEAKTILLVDDVYTTGSTADACTKTLLLAGADKVFVLTCARG